MKFAVSSYSLSSLVNKGEKTEKELISVAKELGFDGIEFAEIHTPEGTDKLLYAKELKEECERVGIEPVQYSVGADFIYGSDGNLQEEIGRLKKEVDVAVMLGVKGMRHDATGGYKDEDKKYKIDYWAKFFKAKTWEEIKMLTENNEYLEAAANSVWSADTTVLSVRFVKQSTLPAKSVAASSTSATVLIPVFTISNPNSAACFSYSATLLSEFVSLVV